MRHIWSKAIRWIREDQMDLFCRECEREHEQDKQIE